VVRPPFASSSLARPAPSSTQFHCYKRRKVNLQSLGEQLVHLGKLGGDAQVDCPVANLDDEATDDIGVDLRRFVRIWTLGYER